MAPSKHGRQKTDDGGRTIDEGRGTILSHEKAQITTKKSKIVNPLGLPHHFHGHCEARWAAAIFNAVFSFPQTRIHTDEHGFGFTTKGTKNTESSNQ